MDAKKTTLIIVAVILIATAVIFGVKLANKSVQAPVASKNQGVKSSPPVKTEAGQSAVQADPDAKALEDDLNSVNDEDFSDNSLSDQNVGL